MENFCKFCVKRKKKRPGSELSDPLGGRIIKYDVFSARVNTTNRGNSAFSTLRPTRWWSFGRGLLMRIGRHDPGAILLRRWPSGSVSLPVD
jgi:hypothetical protein